MKRYRVISMDFDTRAFILSIDVKNDWEPHIIKLWLENKKKIREEISFQYGIENQEQKIKDFIELGNIPFSISAFHNKFIKQARDSFVIGSYYSCLTASSALGERILNQLILHLKNHYKSTKEYKNIYRKKSFDNWDVAIETLESWNILLPNVASAFKDLKDIRNEAIHFNPETDTNDRNLAILAFKQVREIIEKQFGVDTQPWYILTDGVTFIKKEYEDQPFIKEIILPNCKLVGYRHTLERENNSWVVHDNHSYNNKEVSDDEFIQLFKNNKLDAT